MAKAKAGTKAAGDKTKGTKANKLTIDLGNLVLTDGERKKLLDAVHKTVGAKLKAATAPEKASAKSGPLKAAAKAEVAAGATITATFRNVDPGLSELTATHNGIERKITQTGTLDFANVRRGDIIMVQGKSLGKADITINRQADPQEKKFDPGVILFNFFILQ